MKKYSFMVVFEPADEGGYNVSVPSLPGCFTQGNTLEEAREMAIDAIQAYCESLLKDKEPIPQEKAEYPEFIAKLDVALSH